MPTPNETILFDRLAHVEGQRDKAHVRIGELEAERNTWCKLVMDYRNWIIAGFYESVSDDELLVQYKQLEARYGQVCRAFCSESERS